MGNKPDRSRRMQQPYNQMVEDAIAALKDRPGSSQADIFSYLEAKYEGKISPKNKHNLQTVIRSVIQSKKRLRSGPNIRKPLRGRPSRLKAKGGGRKLKRGLPRGRMRRLGRQPEKGSPKLKLVMPKGLKTPKSLNKPGKELVLAKGAKGPGHPFRPAKRGTGRGGKLVRRPARRTTSAGSMRLPSMNVRMRRN